MHSKVNRRTMRRRIRYRIRRKVSGTPATPRLAVYRSLKHIYAQVIDDETHRTLIHASTLDKEVRDAAGSGNVAAAKRVGEVVGQRLKDAGIENVVFDRGGFIYHGRVKALADAVRSAGVKL